MKRMMTLTAAALLTATTGFAATTLEGKLERYVGDVNMAVLSDSDKLELRNVMMGSGTFSERRAIIEALLADKGALINDGPAMVVTIENNYEGLEVAIQRYVPDFNIETVDDQTLLQIQAIMYGNDTEQEKEQKIEGLLLS